MHPFDILEVSNGAKFIFTPCPGTKDTSIQQAFDDLIRAGADAVITVLPNSELERLSLRTFCEKAAAQPFKWFQLPIEDDSEPDQRFETAWLEAKDALIDLVRSNKTIAIHCRGGSGRTGLMAAILLLESGESWDTVKPLIQSIRPKALTLDPHLSYLRHRH